MCGTPQYIFGHGLCRFCYGKEQMSRNIENKAPDSAYKPLSPLKRHNIPNRTQKRLNQEKEYAVICGLIDAEAKVLKRWKCWFCGNDFRPEHRPDHHHVNGRDGDLLTQKKDIKIVHRRCHQQYHDCSVLAIKWHGSWLERIKKDYPDLYEREKEKYNK